MSVAWERCESEPFQSKFIVPASAVVNHARLIVEEPSPITDPDALSERPVGAVLSMVKVGLTTHPVVVEFVKVPSILN